MTPGAFRALALTMPEASEGAHMGHADFRVGGRIFATLGPPEDRAMVKLRPQDQDWFVRDHAATFSLAAGAWGRHGSTIVNLATADVAMVRLAMGAAWHNTAPKKLARLHPQEA